MEKKFTEGNWVSKTLDNSDILIMCDFKILANVLSMDVEYDEDTANSKLMAAAPELLEALNNLVLASDLSSNSPVVGNWNELINNAKNAIKKATE